MIGMKQEALAIELGGDWNQKKVSFLEQKDVVDRPLLQQVANALKLPVEAIENFDEEKAINIVSNTFHNNSHDNSVLNGITCFPTFNPMDKIVELYEALLKSEREKIAMLEKMMNK